MDTERLLDLLTDLESELSQGFEKRVTALITAYTQARDTPAQDHTAVISKARTELLGYLAEAQQNHYPPTRLAMMRRLGADTLFGDLARARIERAILEAHSGPATVVTLLDEFRTELLRFRQAASATRKGLLGMGVELSERPPDECEVGIVIPSAMTGEKLTPLTEQLNRWNKILRTFAELAGEDEREITVKAVASGSVELYVIAACTTASLLVTALEKLADLYKKILEIQTLRKQLKNLNAPVAEPEKIREHEKSLLKGGIDDLVRDLLKQTTAKLEVTRKNELKTQLTISITQMASFIDAGGSVEVSAPPPEDEEDDVESEDGASGEDLTDASPPKLIKQKQSSAELAREKNLIAVRRGGAVLATLPDREAPILQIQSGEPPQGSSSKS